MPGTASPAPPALGTATPVSNRVSGKARNAETVPSWSAANEQKWKIFLTPHSQTLHFYLFFFPRLQSAERRATCPISVGLSDFSHSDFSFACFLTIFTQLTFHGLSVVGGRASFSTFSFLFATKPAILLICTYTSSDSANEEHRTV